MGVRLFHAANQCIKDQVPVRLGSLGGLAKGARSYEMAFQDIIYDFDENEMPLTEGVQRLGFQFGVCMADAERVLRTTVAT